ncbi:tetratricopeptide repeat protein [uncultured Winogradskyella sp.]|uniref:tetratricopeptide repeat protein n=1 Tax=uncultured Winogradskyella sp. TaxID=395353 RepID=UPI0025F25681|nr:tetratricopeptide repeat protein [uncultured Winogradskyella sp.]
MKIKTFSILALLFIAFSCSKSIEYTEAFKKETAGSYLYNVDDVIVISYEANDLFMNWRSVKTKPVATELNEFFVPDMYKKLRFLKHPKTNKTYLSIISETNPDSLSYNYLKAPVGYKTPSQYIAEKNFDKALVGLLKIKTNDSLSEFINQYKFNRIGYKYIREDNFEDAIAIFEMNVKLHPNSPYTYDSLGQAYLVYGDSLNAYKNYKKTYKLNKGNRRAKKYIDNYERKVK